MDSIIQPQVIHEPISSLDIYATISQLIRGRSDDLDGENLIDKLYTSEEIKSPRFLFWKHHNGNKAVRYKNWKLLYSSSQKSYQLFDLEEDIGEQNDQYETHKQFNFVLEMKNELVNWESSHVKSLWHP